MTKRLCSVDGCDSVHSGLGFCYLHYMRFRRNGTSDLVIHRSEGCKVPGCGRPHGAKGYCKFHYWRVSDGRPLETPHRSERPPVACAVDGCERQLISSGYCDMHYRRWRKNGDPGVAEVQPCGPKPKQRRACSVDGCEKPRWGELYCNMHKTRLRRTGEVGPPLSFREIETPGYLTPQGYRMVLRGGRYRGEHRHVTEQLLGRELYKDETVHHINGVRDDNRPENLELWSSSHPRGQRVEDKVTWALEILTRYAPDRIT